MEDQIKKRAPLSLMTVQTKARSLFEAIKGKYSDPYAKFVASNGWFNRKARASFHNVKVSCEEVGDKIVRLAEQLELEVDVADVEELIESRGVELSNEDLMELEAAKVAEQTAAEAEDEPVEELRRFNTKEIAIAFVRLHRQWLGLRRWNPIPHDS
jgi:hypothetical protein